MLQFSSTEHCFILLNRSEKSEPHPSTSCLSKSKEMTGKRKAFFCVWEASRRNVGRVETEAMNGWCLNSGLKVGIFMTFLVLDE
ncbi:hypothetical protein NL676_024128 [Syzygium grande]|nr:hypothetical protein NL676_024128 [Syzygium grande]